MTSSDLSLARAYAAENSEAAFAELVSRHINLVYSVALRQVRDAHLAEEVTQVVFIILARKAGSLSSHTILSGWLCRTARNVSARALTLRQRRQAREQEAYMQSLTDESEADAWRHIEPLLDEALAQLGGRDHDAIVLRFFDRKSFKEVGAALGASEDTAKKRVNRTLEKLRRFFKQRGIVLSAAVIAGAVTANSVQAAPAALAEAVTTVAAAKGIAVTGSTLALIKGALKFMAWTKAKMAIVTAGVVLVAGGATTVTVKEIEHYREAVVWSHFTAMMRKGDPKELNTIPRAVFIRPSKLTDKLHDEYGMGRARTPDRHIIMLGAGVPASGVLGHAYDISRTRIVNPELFPAGDYDFLVNVSHQHLEAFQAMIKERYGLVAHREIRETNVLVMTVGQRNAPGLKPAGAVHADGEKVSQVRYSSAPISSLVFFLEHRLKIPVIDKTGLTNRYDLEIKWDDQPNPDPEALKQAVYESLGLQFAFDVQPVEMLVVEKAK